ncbi:PREDICTED: E3 ubiquitin-protein ligase RAD18 [Elephantulus edwardii]|uniref:E3 ubiquitin-protein ligase RAD18 n=1 Tax=Elephantulus edwardii TaxID=28737 RepID=UPI0003F09B89|nr:PREDICTED: E3 ubiquitin-protein ligase RAD18 [Elephantulus edwardii]
MKLPVFFNSYFTPILDTNFHIGEVMALTRLLQATYGVNILSELVLHLLVTVILALVLGDGVEEVWVSKTIDDLLRCGICFEYFNIAMMIPQCSHNYCSLCIRKFLSYKTQCPTCCVTVTEPELRNNRVLDELVKSLNVARNHLLHFAFKSPESPPTLSLASSSSKNHTAKAHTPFDFRHSLKQNFLTREIGGSTSKLLPKENKSEFSHQEKRNTCAKIKETPSVEDAAPGPSGIIPVTPSTSTLKHVTKVDCPVCGVSVSENHINRHLDSCLSREEKKESLRSSGHKRKPLPKIVYNLLSDRDLKKRLKQHGLSVQGNRQQLIKRHQEFVHMYNAQCDSLHPKSEAEIVKEIENIEMTRMRLEASNLNETIMVFTKDQTEKEIDEIHRIYREKHQNEFHRLVDQARKGYKKTAGMSKKVPKEKESSENPVSVHTGQVKNEIKFPDKVSVANHLHQPQLGSLGKLESDQSDDTSGCTDIQEAASSPESDSFNSSSSDIIRDLLEEEEAWESSHTHDCQDTEEIPRLARRKRAAESTAVEPRSKHNKN